jgi:hypothetical protein
VTIIIRQVQKSDLLITLIIVLSHYVLKMVENSAKLFDVDLMICMSLRYDEAL